MYKQVFFCHQYINIIYLYEYIIIVLPCCQSIILSVSRYYDLYHIKYKCYVCNGCTFCKYHRRVLTNCGGAVKLKKCATRLQNVFNVNLSKHFKGNSYLSRNSYSSLLYLILIIIHLNENRRKHK